MSITGDIHFNLSKNFTKCVCGYHLVNNEPIKEAPWEQINAIIIEESGYKVISQSNGSHKSGVDLSCSLGSFSNKSTKYKNNKNSFTISSYRLTTVCSDKTPGNIEDIIKEINYRKNFTYYSIIVREESDNHILYDWYLIPSDYYVLDPSSYKWHAKIGKNGKNKSLETGWETNTINGSSMSITFSMSSQLWIDLHITEEMKQFIIGSCSVKIGRKYNYIQLYENDSTAV